MWKFRLPIFPEIEKSKSLSRLKLGLLAKTSVRHFQCMLYANQTRPVVSSPVCPDGRFALGKDGIQGELLDRLLESRDQYFAKRVFWVPPESRWPNLQNQATRVAAASPPKFALADSLQYKIAFQSSRTANRGTMPANQS